MTSHREGCALILSLLMVTDRLNRGFAKRLASETAVTLWAWRSFARMPFSNIIVRRVEKAGCARNAG